MREERREKKKKKKEKREEKRRGEDVLKYVFLYNRSEKYLFKFSKKNLRSSPPLFLNIILIVGVFINDVRGG